MPKASEVVTAKAHPVWQEDIELRERMYFPAVVACTAVESDVVQSVTCAYNLSDPSQSNTGPQDMSQHACDARVVRVGPNVCYIFNAQGSAYSVSNGFLELGFVMRSPDPTRLLIRLVLASDLTLASLNETLYDGALRRASSARLTGVFFCMQQNRPTSRGCSPETLRMLSLPWRKMFTSTVHP